MSDDARIAELLARARRLADAGEDTPAQQLYLELLRQDATHLQALIELGNLALATGHRSAARTAYRQAIQCHPRHPVAYVNLANLYFEERELAGARQHYEAALEIAPDLPEAHQGLARALHELGEPRAAAPHFERGFAGHALVLQRARGAQTPARVLLLVSTQLGNVAVRAFLDARLFEIAALYMEFYDPRQPLPDHDVIFNAIGDADLCELALQRCEELLTRSRAPLINAPARVRESGRLEIAQRLARLPGVRTPQMRMLSRAALALAEDLAFPLLLRSVGFHTGRHFLRVDATAELPAALAALPGEELLLIEYLDARGSDGCWRKYRVMIIDGALYPLHLAVSAHWKVHYFSSAMAEAAHHREEERRFLESMPLALGARVARALEGVAEHLALDYAGIDFGLASDGSVLLFEANATMAILRPAPDAMWDYRRPAIERALAAAREMVVRRARAQVRGSAGC
ncbi:MAG TPA: tetratricopeptide repeat protein [Steroidobacteraceae bacterium]|nr:tetratricopeptide repeat protein [Steroidobacteraceae bacterium]